MKKRLTRDEAIDQAIDSEVRSLCGDEIDDGNGQKYRCGYVEGHDGAHRCTVGSFWVCWPSEQRRTKQPTRLEYLQMRRALFLSHACKDCGYSRAEGPCPCSFKGNGVDTYYQRRHQRGRSFYFAFIEALDREIDTELDLMAAKEQS